MVVGGVRSMINQRSQMPGSKVSVASAMLTQADLLKSVLLFGITSAERRTRDARVLPSGHRSCYAGSC